MKRTANEIKWMRAERKISKMRPEDVARRLSVDWKAYLGWRRRRKVGYLVLDVVGYMLEGAFSCTSIETLTSIMSIVGVTFLLTVVLGMPSRLIHIVSLFTIMLIVLLLAFFLITPIMCIVTSFIKGKIGLENHELSACTADLKRFLRHRRGPLKNMYRSMGDGGLHDLMERCHRESWVGGDLLDDDSPEHGVAKILYTVFMGQPDAGRAYDGKTFELIELMLVDHKTPSPFILRETGLLVRSWADLSTGGVSRSDYDEKIDFMLSEAHEYFKRAEGADERVVLDRLDSLKRGSDVVNGSPDVARMRDLVDRVHDSSAELVGRTVS